MSRTLPLVAATLAVLLMMWHGGSLGRRAPSPGGDTSRSPNRAVNGEARGDAPEPRGPESPSSGATRSRISSAADTPHWVERKTYRYGSNEALAQSAVFAAQEIYAGKDLPIDFGPAEPGEPLEIRDECYGQTLYAVPLWIGGGYAGVALMKEVSEGLVRASVIRPGSAAWTDSQFEGGIEAPEPKLRQAYLTPEQAAEFAQDEGWSVASAGELVVPCAGPYPLAPPTSPFYDFQVGTDRILISAVTGDVVTPDEMVEFEQANDQLVESVVAEKTSRND